MNHLVDKYKVEIFWSDADACYIANAPELKYCSAHGQTYHEALDNIIDAIQFWLEIAEEKGLDIPLPSRNKIPFAS